MHGAAQGRAQRINGERRRILANVRFTLKETLAAVRRGRQNIIPRRQAGKKERRVLADRLMEERMKDSAQDGRHGHGVQQRPAHSQEGTAIAGAQIHLHKAQPEIAHMPDFGQIAVHAFFLRKSGLAAGS